MGVDGDGDLDAHGGETRVAESLEWSMDRHNYSEQWLCCLTNLLCSSQSQ